MNQPFLIKLVNSLRTEAFYVHGSAADEVLYLTLYLRRTSCFVRTIESGFVFVSDKLASALRTVSDELYLFRISAARIDVYSRDFRDNLAALFYVYHIADMEVERRYDVGIMKRRASYGGTRELYRVKICHGRYRSGTSHLISHLVQSGQCSFGLEFISYCPSRRLGGVTQIALLAQRVYLKHYAIGCHRKVLSLYVPIVDEIEYLL